MTRLIMAFFWLAVAGILLAWDEMYPERRIASIRGTGFSLGWLALLLGVYNLAHWWSERAARRRRSASPPDQVPSPDRPNRKEVVNPEFRFSDPPPE